MATLAVCNIAGLEADTGNLFKIVIQYLGLVSTNRVNTVIELAGLDPTISSVTLELGIENLVKNDLITNYGYTFGLLDSVRLLGALL